MKIKGTQRITIKFDCDDQTANELLERLNSEYICVEWQLEDNVITAMETADGYYEPEVRYTKNGDGSPEYLEMNYEIWEEDLAEVLDNFQENHVIDFETVTCEDVKDLFEDIDYDPY